jgi:valyl-tRNA synthetase
VPVTLTALSDEEVTMVPQESKLYHVRYEIVERPGHFIEVATTRPETIMGDVAVAVNPSDGRYAAVVGLHCRRPLQPVEIPIIADSAVDADFGAGALKITPAHDGLDLAIGQRHGLQPIDVLNPDGTMGALAGEEFVGLDRFVAREKAGQMLAATGALAKVVDHENNVGFSERGHVPIEPRLSEQWFLRYPKVEEAKRAVAEGFIRFHPRRWEKTYLHWLDHIQDWCISRQLWCGHRIPVWYRKGCDRGDEKNWHVSVDGPPDPENWERDEDVLWTPGLRRGCGSSGYSAGRMGNRWGGKIFPTSTQRTCS